MRKGTRKARTKARVDQALAPRKKGGIKEAAARTKRAKRRRAGVEPHGHATAAQLANLKSRAILKNEPTIVRKHERKIKYMNLKKC